MCRITRAEFCVMLNQLAKNLSLKKLHQELQPAGNMLVSIPITSKIDGTLKR